MLQNDFVIKNLTSFKVGGEIKQVYFPTNIDEFVGILKTNPDIKVVGQLSNTLVSSSGYNNNLIVTSKMEGLEINGTKVIADCGIKGPTIATKVSMLGLHGFEFMIGFPGSIGGNIVMNASANEQCISDKLTSVTVFEDGEIKKYSKEEMDFSYRHSVCQDRKIVVLRAEFELEKGDIIEISQQMKNNIKFRTAHQPLLNLPNCGSVFKNPQNDSAGRLLDLVGAKTMSVGGAKVWENHANFIINTGNATSKDILELMDKMSSAVKENFDIELIPEVRYLGDNNKYEEELCKKLQIKSI